MSIRTWQPLVVLVLSLAIGTTAMVVTHLAPAWRQLEVDLLDARLAWGRPAPTSRLVLLPAEPVQLQDRRWLGEVLLNLQDAGAQVIGVDAPLDAPADPFDDRFLAAAAAHPAVVAASRLTETPPLRVQRPLPALGIPDALSVPRRDADGRVRRATLLLPVTNAEGRLVLRPTYLAEILRRLDPDLLARRQSELAQTYFAFRQPQAPWLTVTAAEIAQRDLRGKAILIGPADALHWQAPALQAVIGGHAIVPVGQSWAFALCLLAGLLAGWTFWHGRPLVGLVGTGLVAAGTVGVGTLLLAFDWWAPLGGPLLATAGTGVAGTLVTGLAYVRRRYRVARFFRPYVSPQTFQRLLRQSEDLPDLKSERRVVTVLFSDIAGFTSIAERLPTEEVVQLLNEYLTAMTRIIFANHGTLDKYIGDEVMAVFGNIGPNNPSDDAYRAVKTALEMQSELGRLQEKWLAEGIVPMQIRIGINSGEALVGNIGSPQQMDFTVIGDMVNTAKRLEGLNKAYNTNILISQATYGYVKDEVETRFLGPAPIKGRHEPVPVYALLGWQPGRKPTP